MKNNQVKETKQKKSFKEVVVENKGKILMYLIFKMKLMMLLWMALV